MFKILTFDRRGHACLKMELEGYEISVAVNEITRLEDFAGTEYSDKPELLLYKAGVDVTEEVLGRPWWPGDSAGLVSAINTIQWKKTLETRGKELPSFLKRQAGSPAPGKTFQDHSDDIERANGCTVCHDHKKGCCASDHSSKHITGLAAIALG